MNIGIIGYGKMGKMIKELCQKKNLNVITIDVNNPSADFKSLNDMPKVDVVIDFTSPNVIMDNIKFYCDNKINAVIGTTGWNENIETVKSMVNSSGIGFIYASNFSIGVNIFFKIIENAAKIINNFDDYDIGGHEFHHNQKLDSPSGTAKSIAKILIDNIKRKEKTVYSDINRKIKNNELHFSSTRIGSIPGTHSVYFDSIADTIELRHTARSREGFALGAIHAAQWINGKTGFFEISDMMEEM